MRDFYIPDEMEKPKESSAKGMLRDGVSKKPMRVNSGRFCDERTETTGNEYLEGYRYGKDA